ncbi:hypothetical protein [Streptomyces cyaneogriseus]|uniref:hypothetical protein n=1 Tax=Streptomyces cyaneogriseus TaxID=68192 RepID=UPI000A96295E|nr:hypothetical protein [Streptomyces cyaneogriseus]
MGAELYTPPVTLAAEGAAPAARSRRNEPARQSGTGGPARRVRGTGGCSTRAPARH